MLGIVEFLSAPPFEDLINLGLSEQAGESVHSMASVRDTTKFGAKHPAKHELLSSNNHTIPGKTPC